MAIAGVTTRQDLTDKLSIQQMDDNFMKITSSIEFRATTGSNTFIGNQTISGSLTVTGSAQFGLTSSFNHLYATGARAQVRIDSANAPAAFLLGSITASNYATDIAAASQGVPLGGVYHTNGVLKIRLT
jgi:hypothetical protein